MLRNHTQFQIYIGRKDDCYSTGLNLSVLQLHIIMVRDVATFSHVLEE